MPFPHHAILTARAKLAELDCEHRQRYQALATRLEQLQKQIRALPPHQPLVPALPPQVRDDRFPLERADRAAPGQPALPEQQEAELVAWLARHEPATIMGDQAVPALLERHPSLWAVVRQQLLNRLATEVIIDPIDWPAAAAELWQGLPGEAPAHPHGPWLDELPAALRPVLEERWLQLRLQRWRALAYGHRLETFFEEQAEALAQVVFSMIRLNNQGTALELYLRLLDEGAQFNELARLFATGDERATLGVIGPRRLGSLHPQLRGALSRLALGEVHEPIRIDEWFVLLRLESRQPANLDAPLRQELLEEMLEQDVAAVLAGQTPPHAPQLQTLGPQRLFPHP